MGAWWLPFELWNSEVRTRARAASCLPSGSWVVLSTRGVQANLSAANADEDSWGGELAVVILKRGALYLSASDHQPGRPLGRRDATAMAGVERFTRGLLKASAGVGTSVVEQRAQMRGQIRRFRTRRPSRHDSSGVRLRLRSQARLPASLAVARDPDDDGEGYKGERGETEGLARADRHRGSDTAGEQH